MRRFWIPAVLALSGVLFPWARVIGMSAHLFSEHDHERAARHADDLRESFHGHHHDEGEGDHSHPLIGFDLVALRTRVLDAVVAPAASAPAGAFAALRSIAQFVPLSERPGSNHGPPGGGSRRLVLRI